MYLTVEALAPQASYFFRSPSPDTPSPHFVFDATRVASGGTPRVIGVANPAGRFREDRSLRVHDTPFEQRCAHAGSAWVMSGSHVSGHLTHVTSDNQEMQASHTHMNTRKML